MDFTPNWRPSIIAAALSIALVGCGSSDSDDSAPEQDKNIAPQITSSAIVTAIEDIAYSYQITVTDPDDSNNGTDIDYELTNAPEGMLISDMGLITWTPIEGVLTSGTVTISASDGGEDGATAATQNFEVIVTPVNDSPLITSTLMLTAVEDTLYTSQVVVEDSDDLLEGLHFSLENAPEGMVIDATGLVSWTPTEGVLTSGEVTLTVADGGEDNAVAATDIFEVIVTPVNDAPTVSLITEQTVNAGETFTYQLAVSDVDDLNVENDISFEMISGPAELTISATGLISYNSAVTETTLTDISISVADGGEDGAAPAIVSFSLDEKFFVAVSGSTINYFNGENIVDSSVMLSNGYTQSQLATSDADGNFSILIQDTEITDRLTLSADATGFAEAAISFSSSELAQAHNLLLLPVHQTVSFDASQVNELSVEDTLLVTLPEDSLVNANGDLAETAVLAELTIINPAIDIEMMPGDMLTINEAGEIVPIESFGAITVSFEDENGNPLQLAEGKTAEIRIPAVGSFPPSTIPLYYFDEISGLWVEEGEATLMNDNGQSYYAGNVSHFTTWNADRIYETVFINGCVADVEGTRLTSARLNSDGRDYFGRSVTYSDSNGDFSLPVRQNSSMLIGASLGFQSRTEIMATGSEDITLPECLVLSEALTKITLNWGEAPRDLDSHLFISQGDTELGHVYFGNREVTIEGSVIYLDVDDITSYGPEVISIPSYPVAGVYDYFVYNYSSSPAIDPATTRVEVIFNNEQYLFTPPTEDITLWWHVAQIEKSAEGILTFTPMNEWVDAPDRTPQSLSLPSSYSTQAAPLKALPLKAIDSLVNELINSKYYVK